MSIFTLTIDCDNDAFEDMPQAEVARILHNVAERILYPLMDGTCRDVNGNTVGSFAFDE
jgi:ABC-type Co2+ transport system permease subunit